MLSIHLDCEANANRIPVVGGPQKPAEHVHLAALRLGYVRGLGLFKIQEKRCSVGEANRATSGLETPRDDDILVQKGRQLGLPLDARKSHRVHAAATTHVVSERARLRLHRMSRLTRPNADREERVGLTTRPLPGPARASDEDKRGDENHRYAHRA